MCGWRLPFCGIFLCTVLPVLAFRNVRFDVQYKPKIACFTVKMLSSSGGPPGPHRGLCLLDPCWGQSPQTPLIGSRCRARHDRGARPPRFFRLEPRLTVKGTYHSRLALSAHHSRLQNASERLSIFLTTNMVTGHFAYETIRPLDASPTPYTTGKFA